MISTQPTPVWTELADVSGSTVTIPGLTVDEQYEYKVTPICHATGKPDVAGKETTGIVFTTKQIVKPDVKYTCGATAADRPTNQTPLSKLKVGDRAAFRYFLIGEFPCEVLELTATTAPYKGKAAALVPYLGMSNFSGGVPLMEFEILTLNTDYLVLSGSMRAITDPVLRKKLTDQRNQKDASKENAQKGAPSRWLKRNTTSPSPV